MLPRPAGPLPAGRPYVILQEADVPPEQRQALLDVGWIPGKPLPADLARILNPTISAVEAAKRAAEIHRQTETADYTPTVPAGDLVVREAKLQDLSDEHQAEIAEALQRDLAARQQIARDAIEQANKQHEFDQQQATQYAGLPPQIRQKLLNTEKIEVVDDRRPQPAVAETEAPQPPTAPEVGLEKQHKNCIRCGFPVDRADLVEVTESDKLLWQQSLVGQPFRRTFSYYKNTVHVTLRSLSPQENDEVLMLLRREIAAGTVDRADGQEFYQRYRIAVAIVNYVAGTEEYPSLPSLADWGDVRVDRVKTVYEAVYVDGPLRSDAAARLAGQAQRDFSELQAKLEALATSPDF